MRRVPFVYDVQDIWPEAALVSGLLKRGWLVSLMDKLEKFVYRRADYLLVVTDGARENLISKGVPAAKISVLPHWVEESLFEHSAENTGLSLREEYGWKDRFVVLFAGNIGIVQGLEVVVRAASELQTSIQAQGSGDPLIALVGDGSDKVRLQALADQMGLQNIHFIDRQPMERMPEFMKAADALLVHLKKSEFSRHAIPGKTLAYLADGKPILMAVEGAAAKLVTEAGAGLVVSPEDPVALANAICSVIAAPESERAMMGERGRQYLMENLSKQKVISQYEKVLQRAASQNGQ
jgi:glycosyltransferase involved in cell wall biosynthesis